jgi:hypothetical protein
LLQLSEKERDGEHNNEYAIKMKEQSLEALACHVNSNEGCLLDCNSTLGVLPQSDTFWRFMWGYVQNEMRNKLLETKKKSDELKHGHETRFDKLIEKDWEVVTAIEMKHVCHYVRVQVFGMLVLQSGKQIYPALDMLCYMIGKLKQASNDVGFDFDEYSLVSLKKYKRYQLFEGMLSRAKECIRLMSCRLDKEKLQFLTGVPALFLPTGKSLQYACILFGLNVRAKYVSLGLDDRAAFDQFHQVTGDISVGEMVVCRDGVGVLKVKILESVIVSIEPCQYDKEYCPGSSARLARAEPPLDEYFCQKHSDTTPLEWIDAINKFHQDHIPISPTMRDLAVCCHSSNKALIQRSPHIYRYETWDQLWSEFEKVQPGIADKIRNTNNPNECPMMIQTYALWEMVKGTDSSCLCINCEGMYACQCGCMGAIKVIDQLIMQYNVSSDKHFTVNDNNDDVPPRMNIERMQEHFTLNNNNDATKGSELVNDALDGSESVLDDKIDEEMTDANVIPSHAVPIEDEKTAT